MAKSQESEWESIAFVRGDLVSKEGNNLKWIMCYGNGTWHTKTSQPSDPDPPTHYNCHCHCHHHHLITVCRCIILWIIGVIAGATHSSLPFWIFWLMFFCSQRSLVQTPFSISLSSMCDLTSKKYSSQMKISNGWTPSPEKDKWHCLFSAHCSICISQWVSFFTLQKATTMSKFGKIKYQTKWTFRKKSNNN